jgi:hypothetical protein
LIACPCCPDCINERIEAKSDDGQDHLSPVEAFDFTHPALPAVGAPDLGDRNFFHRASAAANEENIILFSLYFILFLPASPVQPYRALRAIEEK